MSSSSPPAGVSLNDRVAAVATVLCDGELHVLNRDPFVAVMPVSPDAHPVHLRTFPFDAAGTTIVEISSPIATQVPAIGEIDDWALRQARDLFNVYVVREETETTELGSILTAQSSIIATNLSLPVLGLAVDILAATASRLRSEFRDRFVGFAEPGSTPRHDRLIRRGRLVPAVNERPAVADAPGASSSAAVPGYL